MTTETDLDRRHSEALEPSHRDHTVTLLIMAGLMTLTVLSLLLCVVAYRNFSAIDNLKGENARQDVALATIGDLEDERQAILERLAQTADAAEVQQLQERLTAIGVLTERLSTTPGVAGVTGPPGVNGVNGANGAPGATGANGAPGTPGAAGTNGQDGTPGAAGTPGTNGADGAPGAQGEPGSPPQSFSFTYTDSLLVEHTVTCTDPDGDGAYTCTEPPPGP